MHPWDFVGARAKLIRSSGTRSFRSRAARSRREVWRSCRTSRGEGCETHFAEVVVFHLESRTDSPSFLLCRFGGFLPTVVFRVFSVTRCQQTWASPTMIPLSTSSAVTRPLTNNAVPHPRIVLLNPHRVRVRCNHGRFVQTALSKARRVPHPTPVITENALPIDL
jgi:hypothetical protein